MQSAFKLLCAGVCVAALLAAGAAPAATLDWNGTSSIALGATPPIVTTGSGVATVTSTGGGLLSTIQPGAGLTGSQTIPLTDPNNSQLVTLTAAAMQGTVGTLVQSTAMPGQLAAGGGTLPVPGNAKLCILSTGCAGFLNIPLQTSAGNVGIGLGGRITVNGFGKGTHISITGGPWTIDVAKLTGAFTTNAMIPGESRAATSNVTLTGFAHGPASGTSTGSGGGALQYVNANFVETNLNSPTNLISLRLETVLRFVPEPGLMLLLGSGVAGLTLLGRSRMRR